MEEEDLAKWLLSVWNAKGVSFGDRLAEVRLILYQLAAGDPIGIVKQEHEARRGKCLDP